MSNGAGPASPEGERRFKLVVTTDGAGIEHLTIQPIIDLAETPRESIPHDKLVDLACRIYDTRRTRMRYFHESMLGEPVWDMLLALFCLPSRGERLSVSGLALAADVPPTTGLRWTRRMEQDGLIERRPDRKDGRRVHLQLTDRGQQMMRDYLTAIYHELTAA